MATEIRLRRGTAAAWTAANPTLASGEVGYETDTRKLKVGDGSTAWASLSYFIGNLPGATLNDLGDVTITSAASGDFLRWNGSAWINDAVNLSTDTVGDYINTVTASTGVTITGSGGESASPVISIGQDVGTSASVTFAQVTAPLVGNASTASQLQTARTISLTGDVSGSVSFSGSADASISTTIQPNSVALGTDTTGNYVNDVVAGTGVTVTHTPGEGSSASIAIGQDVGTSASVQFGQVTTTGDVAVGGNLTVNGTTTTLNTETLAIEDNIVLLNSNVTGSPTTNAGIEVERGDSSNVVLRWNESTDSWEVTEDGSTYKNIAVGQDVETTSSVSFAAVTASTFTGDLVGNADTASALQTARTIALGGDLSGSVSFDGSSSVTIEATVVNSGVALDEVSDVVITSPEEFQSLTYNGTNWVNNYAPVVTYVRNAEATTLTTGTVVYLFGATGDHATVKRADNDSDTTSSKTVGLVAANIASSENGPVVTRGYVDGIDLSAGYTAGDVLWLGEDGAFTTTKPSAPEHLVFVGVVVRATENGIIYVATQNGYELEELHDVKITSPANNDFLKYNSASAIWINDQINLGTDTVGNYVADVVQGTGILVTHTPGEGSSASIAINADLNDLNDVSAIDSTEGQLLIRTAEGWQNVTASGDVTVNASGVFSIAANSVALGTDTTGNYVNDIIAGTGVTVTHTPGEGSSASIAIGQDVSTTASVDFNRVYTDTLDVFGDSILSNIKSRSEPYITTVDFRTPSANRGIYIPDANGNFAIVSSSTGTVALGTDTTGNYMADVVAGNAITISHTPGEGSTASISIANGAITTEQIANGTITNSDISESANIALLKLQSGSAGQLIVANASGVPAYVSAAGDVVLDASGNFSITENAVALGTNTTGNYMSDVYGGTGVTINHTAGEGSTASISIGQNVATSSSVTFAQVTASVFSVLSTPVNNSDAATKAYVDQVTAGINWHESVKYATAAALPNSPTYNVGSADQNNGTGIGTTITAGTYGRLVIDGANASTGQRVLVKNQPDAGDNGVYDVTEQGSASVYWILTRASDSDNSVADQVKTGDAVYVVDGAVNANQGFIISSSGSEPNNVIRIGTDDITWTQFTGTAAFTAGNGLSTTGNTLNIGTADSGRIVVNADTIDLASVAQTNTTGSDGISFIQSHSVDSYGRLTGVVTASVQNASTTQKGIAQFSASHFSVSSGSVQIASGGITTTEIANGTITSDNISESAQIALLKLQSGTSGQIIVADASGVPSYVTPSGDITVNASGVFSIAANSVALGTDTTGNYMVDLYAGNGITITHTPGEGSTASIALDSVISSTSAGSATTNFVSAITVNGYGQVTDYESSDIQDASTSQKGIAQFNSDHFSVSSGSVSIGQSVATTASPTFGAITINASASVGTNASVSNSLFVANGQIVANESANQSKISLRPLNAGVPYEALRLASQYSIANTNTSSYIQGINSSGNVVAGMQITSSQSTSSFSPVVVIGPRILVSASYASDLSSQMTSDTSSSVHLAIQRTNSSSAAFVLYDQVSGSSNMLEIRDSANTPKISVGTSSNSYMLYAVSASLETASVGAANISNLTTGPLTVTGDLTVNGTTTTINSTTLTVDDPIIVLGGDTAPISDDNKDRGVAFRYYSGTAASVGFMGYDDSTGRFISLTGATNSSEVFSGTNASVQVGSLHVVGGVGAADFVTLSGESSEGRVRVNYASFDQFVEIYSSMSGQIISWKNSAAQTASIQFTSSDAFTFSKPISSASLSSASLSSASIVAPYISGSVQFDTSASVTLPSKTFFPEEYLSVSSSVTLNSTTHRWATLEMTASAGTSVVTVPADASDNFPVGSVIQIIRVGAGEVQVTASAGVTVNNALGSRLRAQWSTATLRKRSSNTWLLSGDLKV
jgi:hypothetical protein